MDAEDQPPSVALNQGRDTEGVFAPPTSLTAGGDDISHPARYGDSWNYVHVYDFDGDGSYDLLWADHAGHAYLHRNLGDNDCPRYDTEGQRLLQMDGNPLKVGPELVDPDEIEDFTTMQGSRAAIIAEDFNEDGRTDVVMSDVFGDIYYFVNAADNAAPAFAGPVKIDNIGSRAKVAAADWGADGHIDLIGASGPLKWYRNRGGDAGDGQFETGRKLNLPESTYHAPLLAIVDWNHDGDLDAMIQNTHYPWFCWLEGSYISHRYPDARIVSVE